MPLLSEHVREQLRERFEERLRDSVQLRLFVRPDSGRLILPSGMGCATCEDTRQLMTEVVEVAPDVLDLEVLDVSSGSDGVEEVPTLQVSAAGAQARISFRGLPGGFEFAALVDAIERVSTEDPGLSPETLERLAMVQDPVEVMVFATPT